MGKTAVILCVIGLMLNGIHKVHAASRFDPKFVITYSGIQPGAKDCTSVISVWGRGVDEEFTLTCYQARDSYNEADALMAVFMATDEGADQTFAFYTDKANILYVVLTSGKCDEIKYEASENEDDEPIKNRKTMPDKECEDLKKKIRSKKNLSN